MGCTWGQGRHGSRGPIMPLEDPKPLGFCDDTYSERASIRSKRHSDRISLSHSSQIHPAVGIHHTTHACAGATCSFALASIRARGNSVTPVTFQAHFESRAAEAPLTSEPGRRTSHLSSPSRACWAFPVPKGKHAKPEPRTTQFS